MTSPSAAPTATLAELYLSQGLGGRARAIYRKLAEGPDAMAAASARRRLEELGPSAAGRIAALESLLEQVQRRRAQRAHVSEG